MCCWACFQARCRLLVRPADGSASSRSCVNHVEPPDLACIQPPGNLNGGGPFFTAWPRFVAWVGPQKHKLHSANGLAGASAEPQADRRPRCSGFLDEMEGKRREEEVAAEELNLQPEPSEAGAGPAPLLFGAGGRRTPEAREAEQRPRSLLTYFLSSAHTRLSVTVGPQEIRPLRPPTRDAAAVRAAAARVTLRNWTRLHPWTWFKDGRHQSKAPPSPPGCWLQYRS